jgi:hypothetical protein
VPLLFVIHSLSLAPPPPTHTHTLAGLASLVRFLILLLPVLALALLASQFVAAAE